MRMRSTGLGKTELEVEIGAFKRVDGYMLIDMHSTAPVKWHIRVAVSRRDILQLVKHGAAQIVLFVVTGVKGYFTDPTPPQEY
jgi:hypothetical protein